MTGRVKVGVSEELPIPGVNKLLGNDLAGSKVVLVTQMVENPLISDLEENVGVF